MLTRFGQSWSEWLPTHLKPGRKLLNGFGRRIRSSMVMRRFKLQ